MELFKLSDNSRRLIYWILLFLLITRLICIFLIPLTDTTEARYAEIARKMLETDNWITPQHDYGVPFWAKPPLSIWLSAFSMKVFGIHEFGARLPSLLLSIGVLALIWRWSTARRGRDFALLACTLLASSALFFLTAGAVMTDASMLLCITATMVSFWQARQGRRGWGWLFFAAAGVGLLAKGPVVLALTALPLVLWLLLRGDWRQVWAALPWLRGSALMLAIALPWYLLAEQRTPGFIDYFLVGEHFNRFIYPGWQGDRYGNPHAEPFGMIWGFWFNAAFPWSLLLPIWLLQRGRWRQLRDAAAATTDNDGWLLYLLLWAGAPLLFFTFASNTIWTYPLAALPAFAVLAAELYARRREGDTVALPPARLCAATGIIACGLLILAGLYTAGADDSPVKSSQKKLAQLYLSRSAPGDQLLLLQRRCYSAEFYSRGQARVVNNPADIRALLHNGALDFIAVRPGQLEQLTPELRAHFQPLGRSDGYELLRERNNAPL